MTDASVLTLDPEGLTTAARGLRIRVLDRESATRQVVDKVDLGASEIPHADRVHKERDAVGLEDLIGLSIARAFLDHQTILETRAPSALNEDAKTRTGLIFLG